MPAKSNFTLNYKQLHNPGLREIEGVALMCAFSSFFSLLEKYVRLRKKIISTRERLAIKIPVSLSKYTTIMHAILKWLNDTQKTKNNFFIRTGLLFNNH